MQHAQSLGAARAQLAKETQLVVQARENVTRTVSEFNRAKQEESHAVAHERSTAESMRAKAEQDMKHSQAALQSAMDREKYAMRVSAEAAGFAAREKALSTKEADFAAMKLELERLREQLPLPDINSR